MIDNSEEIIDLLELILKEIRHGNEIYRENTEKVPDITDMMKQLMGNLKKFD